MQEKAGNIDYLYINLTFMMLILNANTSVREEHVPKD
jgi:hypothetical protein